MLVLCAGAASALAQSYPDRPLRLIVPFPAGGGVDTMARILANKLTDVVKQTVLVEHKPGAGGNVGSDFVAKSPPDGYTILLNVNGIAISPSLYRKLSFDPLKDLVGVTQVAATQFLLTGSPKLEAKTVQEVIALARAKPGTLNYGSSGVGAPLHLQAEIFKHAAGGLQIMHIPYRGDAPMLTALLSGDVQIAFMPQSTGPLQVLIRADQRARRHRPQALAVDPRRPDDDGSRRRWHGRRKLVRLVCSRGHAAPDSADAAAGDGQDACRSGGQRRTARPARSRSAARRRTFRPSSSLRSHALPA